MGTRSALMPKPWLPPQLYAVSLNLRTTGIILGRLGMAKTREPGNLPAMNETRTLGWRVIGSSYVHVFVFCSRCGFHAGHFRASGSCRPSWLLHHPPLERKQAQKPAPDQARQKPRSHEGLHPSQGKWCFSRLYIPFGSTEFPAPPERREQSSDSSIAMENPAIMSRPCAAALRV